MYAWYIQDYGWWCHCVCVTTVCQAISSLLSCFFLCRIPPQICIYLYRVPAHLRCHNASVKESKVSVAPFMLTWKSTCPSGNTVLNMDSVWVPLQLPPRPHQTPNQCQCLHVWIRVSGCFCNAEAPDWREAYLGNAVWLPNKHKQWL